jgi:CheY-like chemotaxis protein
MIEVKTILIAEDDENDIFFLKRLLSRVGEYKVHIVRDGPQAIRYLGGEGEFQDRQMFPRPCCLILDLGLPKKDGLEILEWLKSHPEHSTIPVLVCSGSEFPEHVERAQSLGAVSVLTKPADLRQMSSFIERVKVHGAARQNMGSMVPPHRTGDASNQLRNFC